MNVNGRPHEHIPNTIGDHPDADVYAFVETWCDQDSCLDISWEGFEGFHCVRANSQLHGGITVLLKAWMCHHGVRVSSDPRAGILWIDIDALHIVLAICYFSPASSSLYNDGTLHHDPVSVLMEGFALAHAKGLHVVALGDFNIRVGNCSDDIPGSDQLALPPTLESIIGNEWSSMYAEIPAARSCQDASIRDKRAARALLSALKTTSCVVLNGRAPGDTLGRFTFDSIAFRRDGAASRGAGRSVVDLGVVSAELYSSVVAFEVVDSCGLSDHCMLHLCMNLLVRAPSSWSGAHAGSKARVLRPYDVDSITAVSEALHHAKPRFAHVADELRAGRLEMQEGFDMFLGTFTACVQKALPRRSRRRVIGRHDQNKGAPWFDDELRLLKRQFLDAWRAFRQDESDVTKVAAGMAAKTAYRIAKVQKRAAFVQDEQIRYIGSFFTMPQGLFWRIFHGRRQSCEGLPDVTAWTEHFKGIMGSPPSVIDLQPSHFLLQHDLYHKNALPQGILDGLNEPFSFVEVAEILQSLPKGKAADSQGLTCELLRLAASPVRRNAGQPEGANVDLVCAPVIDCITILMNMVPHQQSLPSTMRISRLTPVPKAGAAASRHHVDMNMFRGISIQPVLSRVLERALLRRLDTALEREGVRAPTQCGFRKEHGTLDAVFTLQHLMHKARYTNQRLYVIFVDFTKAFDRVRRECIIDRCKGLGIHGEFLNMLMLLYDSVQQQVCIGGVAGEVFDTFMGTKQGSELSPLLFGVFMDMLHELIAMRVEGAGPVVGKLSAPDVDYADDVALIAALDDHQQAQCILDCLSLFCYIFGVDVNLRPDKTCAVAFRRPGTPVPRRAVLRFNGTVLPFQPQYKHLGLVLHATKGIHVATDALAASGDRAMRGLQARCRVLHITQLAFKCRLFDTLVEPILSYGSHVWGPYIVSKRKLWQQPCTVMTTADKLHITYLRHLSGVGKHASVDVILMDFERLPVWVHWVVLGVRWLHKLQDMQPADGQDSNRLAYNVWLSDIDLFLSGCSECWTACMLDMLGQLALLPAGFPAASPDRAQILKLHVDEGVVRDKLTQLVHDTWRRNLHGDPRSAPSDGLHMSTYMAWVRGRQGHAPHLTCFASFRMLQCLCRYRIGWHQLRVQTEHRLDRAERHCRLCSTPNAPYRAACGDLGFVEDLLHFVLECPAYSHIRRKYPQVFHSATTNLDSENEYMTHIFTYAPQQQLAACLYTMDLFRKECLKLPAGTHVPVGELIGVVNADIELIKAANIGRH